MPSSEQAAAGRGIRFGVQAAQDAMDYPTVQTFCLEIEKLGYDSAWLCDHFMPAAADRKSAMLEAWTTLAALAAETERIRIGTLVLCNSFRQPSLIAKMAATLDVISNGRLEFGIGAGWFEAEYEAYGYDFPKPSVRIRQMAEAIEICKRMWTEEAASFDGQYYRIKQAPCEPKPVQKPHPPVWVGGAGDYMLKVIAEHADKWNCPGLTPAEVTAKSRVLEERCRAAGRNASEIEKTWYGPVFVDEDEAKVNDTLQRRASRRNQTVEEFTKRMIAGTPNQCIAKIEEYVAAGVTYFTVNTGSLRDLRTPAIFAEQVVAHFK